MWQHLAYCQTNACPEHAIKAESGADIPGPALLSVIGLLFAGDVRLADPSIR